MPDEFLPRGQIVEAVFYDFLLIPGLFLAGLFRVFYLLGVFFPLNIQQFRVEAPEFCRKFGGGGYLQMVGIASADGWTTALARLRAVRDSIDSK